jgi:hypothetical protein
MYESGACEEYNLDTNKKDGGVHHRRTENRRFVGTTKAKASKSESGGYGITETTELNEVQYQKIQVAAGLHIAPASTAYFRMTGFCHRISVACGRQRRRCDTSWAILVVTVVYPMIPKGSRVNLQTVSDTKS